MIEDIKAYLYIFAKNLGHNLSENDYNLNEIAKQIESRLLYHNNFLQNSHSACKKCIMQYEERGDITNKKYKYCIFSGEISKSIPMNCPKIGSNKLDVKQQVFDNTEDNTIEDIRKGVNYDYKFNNFITRVYIYNYNYGYIIRIFKAI